MHKGLLMALAVAVPGAALAADAPRRDEEQLRLEARERARSSMSSDDDNARNFTVRGMGGPVTYTGDAANFTTPGAAYGVNVGWDFARNLGAELGYQGQAYSAEPRAPGGYGSGIMENGGQALAKVRTDAGNFEPYALGGLNVSRLNVADDAATAGLIQDNTVLRLPVGAGVDYKIPSSGAGNVTVGLRGLYQFGLDKGAFPAENNASASSQLMGVASVGGNW